MSCVCVSGYVVCVCVCVCVCVVMSCVCVCESVRSTIVLANMLKLVMCLSTNGERA